MKTQLNQKILILVRNLWSTLQFFEIFLHNIFLSNSCLSLLIQFRSHTLYIQKVKLFCITLAVNIYMSVRHENLSINVWIASCNEYSHTIRLAISVYLALTLLLFCLCCLYSFLLPYWAKPQIEVFIFFSSLLFSHIFSSICEYGVC